MRKFICMLLMSVLIFCCTPAALAAEIVKTELVIQETAVSTEYETISEETQCSTEEPAAEIPSLPTPLLETMPVIPETPLETVPETIPEVTLETIPETTPEFFSTPEEITADATESLATEETTEPTVEETDGVFPEESVPGGPSFAEAGEDEWLFTLTDSDAGSAPHQQPESEFLRFTAENKLVMLLISLVFLVAGTGTCWVGQKLGGTKLLLRLRGVKTTGTLSRVTWDSWNRAYRCTMKYCLESGKVIESDWPVLLHGCRMKKKEGKTYTIYYNPRRPKEFDCRGFAGGQSLGTLTTLVGFLLILVSLAIPVCILITLLTSVR